MQWLLHNFWLKFIAVAMGLLIWLHVATEKTYTYRLELPVSGVILKDNLVLADEPPESLYVAVSATGKQLLRRVWRREGVRINAAGLSPGRHQLQLERSNTSLAGSSQQITLEGILSPSQIQLTVDKLISKTVPVEIDLDAEADEGFAVNPSMSVTPNEVTVSGPRSRLGEIRKILTAKKELSGLRTPVTLRLPLESPGGHSFSVTPDSVTVVVDIVPVKTRIYNQLPVVIFNSPPDTSAVTNPRHVRVELTGPPAEIDLLNRNALTVSADFRERDSSGMAPVQVACPAHFRVRKISVDSVQILLVGNADAGNRNILR